MSQIIIDPGICNGRPTVQGSRITDQTVLAFLSAGDSVEDVPTNTRHERARTCLRVSDTRLGCDGTTFQSRRSLEEFFLR
jgi:hypothetical protein